MIWAIDCRLHRKNPSCIDGARKFIWEPGPMGPRGPAISLDVDCKWQTYLLTTAIFCCYIQYTSKECLSRDQNQNTNTHWSSFTLPFIQFLVDVHLHHIPTVRMQISVHRTRKNANRELFSQTIQMSNCKIKIPLMKDYPVYQDCFTDSTVATAH